MRRRGFRMPVNFCVIQYIYMHQCDLHASCWDAADARSLIVTVTTYDLRIGYTPRIKRKNTHATMTIVMS